MKKQMRTIITVLGRNEPDLLPHVALIMNDLDIHIFGHSGNATTGRELLTLLVGDPDRAKRAIEKKEIRVRKQEWVTAEMSDQDGGPAILFEPLIGQNITIYSSFSYCARNRHRHGIVLETSNPERVLKLLEPANPDAN